MQFALLIYAKRGEPLLGVLLNMPSDAFKSFCTHKRSEEERLTAGNRGLRQAAQQQLVHPKWVRGATTVKHYVFEVILWSFCALFKTLTASYQSRRPLELHRNTNGVECVRVYSRHLGIQSGSWSSAVAD